VIGPGTCDSYWTTGADNWVKVDRKAQSNNLFIKLSPISKIRARERELLLSDKRIKPFNDTQLFSVFFDKLLTYKTLPNYAIPTVKIGSNNESEIQKAIDKINSMVSKHRFSKDFSAQYVLKDRFGAGGINVHLIDKNRVDTIKSRMREDESIFYVLQPFLKFDKGFKYLGKRTSTDIRLIFHHDKLLQSYIRISNGTDFRCNEHQGGKLIYTTFDLIPQKVLTVAQKIVTKINRPESLYALDFAVSNSGKVYFIEGNMGPGLDWDVKKELNEKMSKRLITHIVNEFVSRIDRAKQI